MWFIRRRGRLNERKMRVSEGTRSVGGRRHTTSRCLESTWLAEEGCWRTIMKKLKGGGEAGIQTHGCPALIVQY
jgi:hypothetical protein